MNQLSLKYLNDHAPYNVVVNGADLLFSTDYGVDYRVSFMEDYTIWSENAYQFLINKRNKKASPGDVKLKETIIAIIDAFFIANPCILLYICETGDDKQLARNRLFVRWFNESHRQQNFYFRDVTIEADGIDNYAAIIVQRSNPELDTIVCQFDEFIALMSNKPQ